MPNPDRLLLESGAPDGYLLEDGSGVLLMEIPPCYRDAIRADSPVGYWRLGEPSGTNANDEISTNDGTYTNTPTLGVAGVLAGDSDTAVTFAAGSSEYVNIAHVAAFNFGNAWTIEAWITPTIGAFQVIVSKSTDAYALEISAAGRLLLRKANAGTLAESTPFLSSGVTYYVVGTKDGPTRKLYIDGSEVALVVDTDATTIDNSTPLLIGGDWDAGNNFTGTIDEVAVYNYALTPTQVATHYAARLVPCPFVPYRNPMPPLIAQ